MVRDWYFCLRLNHVNQNVDAIIPRMWARIKEFVFGAGGWAVASDLASFVFFLTSIAVATKWGASSLTAFALMVISVPLFWIGAFKAWDAKAIQLEKERTRNAKPEIVGRIVLAAAKAFGESSHDGVTTPCCFLSLKLSVTSRTNVDTTLKDAQARLETNGRIYVGQRLPITGIFWYQARGKSETMQDLVLSVTYNNPIRYRVASEGWLEFMFEEFDISDRDVIFNPTFTIELIDELGDKHVIIANDVPIRR